MKHDKSRRWITGQCEYWLHRFFVRYGGKCSGFTRFDRHSTEMNRSFEMSLDDGFEEVCGTHRCPACRNQDIGSIEAFADSLYMGVNSFTMQRDNQSTERSREEQQVERNSRYLLIRNNSKVEYLIAHALKCGLKRWPVRVPYASPCIFNV